MRNSKLVTLLAIVALAVALFALWRTTGTTGREDSGLAGKTEPNIAPDVDRVANANERTRMETYVANLQSAKQIVTTIKGLDGETIDCVDVNGQPSLRRPEMRGHVVQMQPSTLPQGREASLSEADKLSMPSQLYGLNGERCPERSVPMTRLTMDTLKRFRTLDEFLRKQGNLEAPTGGGSTSKAPHEYAHARRSVDNWGAESNFNVWSPFVETASEFALSQIWVTRGAGGDRETVETGWQVYRDLYGDWRAHLFIYFTPDNYGSGGCYNLSCSGFVQVNNTIHIGGGFANYSSENGAQYSFKLLWYKDGREGHWWLRYGDTWVGYYPRSLFDANGLQNAAANIDFGGEIVNSKTDNRHTRTDMGSGNWPYQGFGYAAYQRGIRYVDTSNFYQQATGLNRIVTNDRCYDLSLQSSSGDWEQYFYFGGSGRNTQCP
jgi:hypothetical protein